MNGVFATAVHALVYLANHPAFIDSETLAFNACTNPARIRLVMGKLHKAKLVITKEGVKGGYQLALAPQQLDLCQVLDAVDAPVVKNAWHSGGSDMNCLISTGMASVMDGVAADLNQLCRKHLQKLTIKDLSNQIFAKK